MRYASRPATLFAAAAAMSALLVASATGRAGEWKTLEEVDVGPQPGATLVERAWADVIKSETDAAVSSGEEVPMGRGKFAKLQPGQIARTSFVAATLNEGGATYTVSVMLQRSDKCDNGENSATSTEVHALCPLRVSRQVAGASDLKTTQLDRACFVLPDPESPHSYTRARLDGSKLTVESLKSGAPIPGCTYNVNVN